MASFAGVTAIQATVLDFLHHWIDTGFCDVDHQFIAMVAIRRVTFATNCSALACLAIVTIPAICGRRPNRGG
jgi:hypothetical protein